MEPPVSISIAPTSIPSPTSASVAGLTQLDFFPVELPQIPTAESPVAVEGVGDSDEPKVAIETVAVAKVNGDSERQGSSFGVWLIGIGSLILIAFGLIRRFSGR
jgi:hypothetical protein